MGSALQTGADPAVVGFDAGWMIEFRLAGSDFKPAGDPITFTRGDYYGDITVDSSASFGGSRFDITVDGLSDTDYNRLVAGPYVFAKIKLGWRDLGSGPLAAFQDVGALFTGSEGSEDNYYEVIHGRILTSERTAGEFRYRTRFTGTDYNWELLRCTQAIEPAVEEGDSAGRYAELLCEQAGVPCTLHLNGGLEEPIDSVLAIPRNTSISGALDLLARTAHGEGADRRIPIFLRTDGVHFGPWLAPVVPDTAVKRLELKSGLVETKPVIDPDPGSCNPDVFSAAVVLRYDLTLRGRADVQIGDEVEVSVDIPAPNGEAKDLGAVLGGIGDVVQGIAGMFGPTPEPAYSPFRVISVKHHVSRTMGFTTVLRVEAQPDGEAISTVSVPVSKAGVTALDEAGRTAAVLAVTANERRREVEVLDIGEINAQHLAPGSQGSMNVAAQRVDVQEGLLRDSQGNGTVRLERADDPTQLLNKPYLTLFAFGSTGLVLPHYPGMRVANLHYQNDVSQTIVGGCLWRDNAEPVSQAGDWWLSLPTAVSEAESIDDSRQAQVPEGPCSHDLIDKDGKRAIHIRGLRISVGDGLLPDAGIRPDDPPQDEVLIEHNSGAMIHIDVDGNIRLETAADMTFKANKITLDVVDSVEVK